MTIHPKFVEFGHRVPELDHGQVAQVHWPGSPLAAQRIRLISTSLVNFGSGGPPHEVCFPRLNRKVLKLPLVSMQSIWILKTGNGGF